MTEEETKKILTVIQATYPNFYQNMDTKKMLLLVNVWHEMFRGYEYSEISLALRIFLSLDTKGFPPVPGQIIEHIPQEEQMNETQAWLLVSKALRNGYYGAKEEFEKLPPIVQKSVGSPEQLRNWSQASIESVESVIQSNFMRTYRAELIRERNYKKLPEEMRNLISNTLQNRIESAD